MNIYEKIKILEDHEKSKNKKEMMKLIRKAVTKLSKVKVSTISPQMSINFRGIETDFNVTVFQKDGTNRSYTFYNFYKPEDNDTKFENILSAIKKDDFKVVSESMERYQTNQEG